MNVDDTIRELNNVIKSTEGKQYNTFELNTNAMARSCLSTILDQQTIISSLEQKFKDLKNEHCLNCGKYKLAHVGACDGCKWSE